jgi:hypothetical protein
MQPRRAFATFAMSIVLFALAMAYLESAVVVYLNGALGAPVGDIFPLRPAIAAQGLVAIEVGREAATLVMIALIGVIAGRTWVERLAWSAVVFGAWDIGYYGWLFVFSGWPPSLATNDLLFLIPVPWVGPVWSPIAVSLALVGFGLAAAHALRQGQVVAIRPWHIAAGVGGGVLVILSWTLDFWRIVDGGFPGDYPWPVFVAGMLVAAGAAVHALSGPRPGRLPASSGTA